MRYMFLLIVACLAFAVPATAQNKAKTERAFQTWLERSIWPEARRKGVSRGVFDAAFNGVTLNWKLPDLVPPGSKVASRSNGQAEFGAPGRYFGSGSVGGATSVGRQMAKRHAKALARTEARTGVPGRIILAIWGRETGYGRADIPHNAFEVLGTKGFMSTRAAYFTSELIAALQIAQSGQAPGGAGGMKSSWAGALGQPQFMPSNVLRYGRDGDGDGRADIWRSVPDTIASIGHYLQQFGWQSGRDWGFEVTLPATLSCALEGPDQARPIRDWAAMGIRRVSGKPFPAHELRGTGSLMLPAGRNGPAFVVTPNFYVLKEYNKSDLYALFVGHVGDRIQFGAGNFTGSWASVDRLRRAQIASMQRGLEALGHDVGGADGLVGFKTRRAIGRWQTDQGRTPTCFPNASVVRALARG